MAYPIYPNFFAFVGDEKDQLPVATPYILPLSTLIATDLFVEWYVVVTYAPSSRSLFFPGAVLLSTAFVVNAKYSLPAYTGMEHVNIVENNNPIAMIFFFFFFTMSISFRRR